MKVIHYFALFFIVNNALGHLPVVNCSAHNGCSVGKAKRIQNGG